MSPITLQILNFIIPLAAAAITTAVTILLKAWIKKLGIDKAQKLDGMIDDYVEKAVDAVERAALAYTANSPNVSGTSKVPSATKKQRAVGIVIEELKQSGVRDVAENLIANRIEAALEKRAWGK